jgi:SAM-dependent methyltransferase
MADYTNMADYYDIIMTSGYYDYDSIVKSILHFQEGQNILEIGCGTGLILEQLVKQKKFHKVTGMDLTKAMLEIADERLKDFDNVCLFQQNIVTLSLMDKYDMAFSYGGVWYFFVDDNELFLVSHLSNHTDNQKGLEQLSKHINSRGKLLLGIQGPHYDYEKTISNGMLYSQKITSTDYGFIKDYYLSNNDKIVMSQTINYRVYSFDDAVKLLADYGFEYQPVREIKDNLFIEFKKL